jgi:transposase
MRIIGCDLHARQQAVAMLDTTTGEIVNMTLKHEGNNVREFYSSLPRPVRVGIEATGSMQWFVNLMEELGIECLVGHPAQIRAAEPRKQKHDRRDADLILKVLVENRFPAIWLPSKELQDLRSLLRHRHQWVRMRTRIQNALQSIAWRWPADPIRRCEGGRGATLRDESAGGDHNLRYRLAGRVASGRGNRARLQSDVNTRNAGAP